MANTNLRKAKVGKNDEFYTQYCDIQQEMNAYVEYNPNVFRDKTILLPCDDPEWSNFTKFFALNFENYGIKKLISTSYAPESKEIKAWQPTLFETENPRFDADKSKTHGKLFVLDRDVDGNGKIDIDDLQWEYLEGDGDFRSGEVRALRDEADIIITNPPFSLLREFVAWIMGANKKFAIIANQNAITYKEIFPLLKDNKIWIGNKFGDMAFLVPDYYEERSTRSWRDEEGNNWRSLGNACWFTNLDHGKRHHPLDLMTMEENIMFSKHKEVKGIGYYHYENYDAIEVPFYDAIPVDYDGVMGVPKTFLDKYCPEQFELIGMGHGNLGVEAGIIPYDRKLKKINKGLRDGDLFYMKDGMPIVPFTRILIRKKQ